MQHKMMKFLWGGWLLGLFFSSLSLAQQSGLPERTITLNQESVVVELAQTPKTRSEGLMHRFPLPDGRGMLFVFPAPQPQAFWMKNTPAPLSIAFINKDGVILNIEDMMPLDEITQHYSNGDALFALEVRKGWFHDKHIKAGDIVKNLPPPAAR
ncbi:MAG: DUF192 domain-containing protein [Burkholderiales bacterium]|jgi:uncharacterized membrane protein (UPF0127 family)|nr:DUF192 domain-containing protein [Burkholderiales bacterium]